MEKTNLLLIAASYGKTIINKNGQIMGKYITINANEENDYEEISDIDAELLQGDQTEALSNALTAAMEVLPSPSDEGEPTYAISLTFPQKVFSGKYYSYEEVLYRCKKDGIVVVQNFEEYFDRIS